MYGDEARVHLLYSLALVFVLYYYCLCVHILQAAAYAIKTNLKRKKLASSYSDR